MRDWIVRQGVWTCLLLLSAGGCGTATPAPSDPPSDASVDAGAGGADTSTVGDGTVDAEPGDADAPDDVKQESDAEDAASNADASALEDGTEQDASSDASVDASSDDATADGLAGDAEEADVDAGPPLPQPCSPTLALTPAATKVLSYDLITFAATGGTGAHRFTLVSDGSGALVNELTGAYLSGPKEGTTDKVKLVDLGCQGEAFATVTVVKSMVVAPTKATVSLGQKFVFAVTEGSGEVKFAFHKNLTGGTLNGTTGAYQAGSKPGTDEIRVQDKVTGQVKFASVQVATNTKLTTTPARLALALGASADLIVLGGTGHYVVSGGQSHLKLGPGTKVQGLKPGTVTVTLTDKFTKLKVSSKVTVVKATEHDVAPTGDGYLQCVARRVPDLNGDGKPEAVLSLTEADVIANNAGAVYVYNSTPTGLTKDPVQVLGGVTKESLFGHSMEVADVSGDGRADLIVGAAQEDYGAIDTGAVMIFYGQKSGKFSEKPDVVLTPPYSYDHLGRGVAVCDVNGDGRLDIIGGAMYSEDRKAKPVVNSTGGIYVWFGYQDGFLQKPDQYRPGILPDGKGGWASVSNSRMGWDVAAGDVNGDGVCDVAFSSLHHKIVQSNDGVVALYLGQKAEAGGMGGLTDKPVRIWHGAGQDEKGSQFGRDIAFGDLDDDGKDELIVGQAYFRGKPAITARGAVQVFSLKGVTAAPATGYDTTASAVWTVKGAKSYDRFGTRLSVGDFNLDGVTDLFAFHQGGEVDGGTSNVGVMAVYQGKKGALPDTKPSRELAGVVGGDSFGAAMAEMWDADGDGLSDMFIFAGQDDTIGYQVGRPYWVPSKDNAKHTALNMPSPASGARFGMAASFLGDLNGDGFPELGVSAPYDSSVKDATTNPPTYVGTRTGSLMIYAGTAGGVALDKPAWSSKGFFGHTNHDYFGWAMSADGDFNNDGVKDLAVLAYSDDRPSTFGTGFVKGTKCAGGSRNNASATYLFLGQKNGMPASSPRFVAYGYHASDYAHSLTTGADVNGDGFDDVIIGGINWDASGVSNGGGWSVFWGKKGSADPGLEVLCQPDYTYVSPKSNDYLGRAVAPLGDIDGDGCDEFAVGGDAIDLGISNQGAVHVVYGWGNKCKSNQPRHVVLLGGSSNARAGFSLASMQDIDGDKINDLLVGGFYYSNGSASVGTVWVVTGAYLKTLKPAPIEAGKQPTATAPVLDAKSAARLTATGVSHASNFGWSVSFVPKLESDGRAGILVGAPKTDAHGEGLIGGADVFRWIKGGADPGLTLDPMLTFVGESGRPGSLLGSAVTAAKTKSGGAIGAVSGQYATPYKSATLDNGAVYVFPIPSP